MVMDFTPQGFPCPVKVHRGSVSKVVEESHNVVSCLVDDFNRLLVQVLRNCAKFVWMHGESKCIHSAFESPEWVSLIHIVPAREEAEAFEEW